jgi:lysophospholipase L1-like esterase
MTFSATAGGEELIVQVQRAGENVFGAMLVVAMVQALVALIEYRTNPQGELIVPPGLTYGTATGCTSTVMPPGATATVPVDLYSRQTWVEHLSSKISTETSQYARIINRINQGMVVLIPWASQMLGWLLRRNTHLFHFGFIILVAGLFDIPNRWIAERLHQKITVHDMETRSKDWVSFSTSTSPHAFSIEYGASHEKPIGSLVVIGDSLAVGLGSVNVYDAAKNNSMPFYRIENIDAERTEKDAPGPVFPRVLAETLAYRYKSNVRWRSAGVDGGDVALIQEFCFGIIEEEVAKGEKPDVVVILCGVNDLKYFVSNPFQGAGPRIFRRRLDELIQKIQYTCGPHTKIVIPMFPTQMFRANSPLNIFPLNFFLDGIVGFWDSQKKLVADRYRSDNVLYVGLRPSEILEWYQKSISNDELETASTREGLIAADGIHPNAKCYSLWAKFLGAKL